MGCRVGQLHCMGPQLGGQAANSLDRSEVDRFTSLGETRHRNVPGDAGGAAVLSFGIKKYLTNLETDMNGGALRRNQFETRVLSIICNRK